MQKKAHLSILVIFVYSLLLCNHVSATLYDRGDGFIYDDVLDVTWYDYTSEFSTYNNAQSWASTLEVYYPDTDTVIDDWRLPEAIDLTVGETLTWGYDGTSHNWGYNLTNSELGHLFYEELGNKSIYNVDGSQNRANKYGLNNTSYFNNLTENWYWFGTSYGNYPMDAWMMTFANGCQQTFTKGGMAQALAVRDGDVLAYEPPAPNQPPILDPIGNFRIVTDELFEISLFAYDPDLDDTLTFASQAPLPENAYFDVDTGTFSWIPWPGQEGTYNIEFFVYDNGLPIELDTQIVTITVGDMNMAPAFIPVLAQIAMEYETIEFLVEADDPDGDLVEITTTSLPDGAFFDDLNGTLTWTPDSAQVGNHTITFIATESYEGLTDQMDVVVTVGDIASPIEFADTIINSIVDYGFSIEIEDDYVATIQKAKRYIETSKVSPATNNINTFIGNVEQDVLDGITSQQQGDKLINMANELLLMITPAEAQLSSTRFSKKQPKA